ncbi:hypothetical protein COO91_10808 (plasmid) [Nostoc flagelliforme CCNUN1]|uniref:Uncharacterized protein n=1 Tax=Nostoc flagelliforme CCNUN1 TaxID=2038116 RepID=A0A2K8TA80_9NOSO|nr:hypothetical protein COO91_10808 [Nostoc flagelliforme CCNUN1]
MCTYIRKLHEESKGAGVQGEQGEKRIRGELNFSHSSRASRTSLLSHFSPAPLLFKQEDL